jgi:hypothetical protein
MPLSLAISVSAIPISKDSSRLFRANGLKGSTAMLAMGSVLVAIAGGLCLFTGATNL